MPDFYLQEGQRFQATGDAGISEGIELTASASTNTKGSYTQLLASSGFAASGLLVTLGGNSNNGSNFLVDIAIGGAGSEQVIIPNLWYTGSSDGLIMPSYWPVPVPSGQRISARVQCSTGSGKVRVMCFPMAGGFQTLPGSSRVTAYGLDTANSRGSDFQSSASTNTKGSWTQIVSATTAPMQWANLLAFPVGTTQYLFDVGVGGSGSEVVVVPNLNIRATGQELRIYSFPLRIAKGARIAARCQAANASQSVRMVLYGVG